MSAKPLWAEYENFLPFRERVRVPLADLGLVHVVGRNLVSASADSNGSGKSTLVVDGPAWVLFGETLRGLKADSVACRHAEGPCVGEVAFDVGSGGVIVRRQARPTRLQLLDAADRRDVHPDLGVRELQSVVESILGFGLRTYRNAVVFGQGSFDRFAQADQAEQFRMLDEIQGLDFRGARDRAKRWCDEAAANREAAARDIERAEYQARQLDQQLADLEAQRARFEGSMLRRIGECERACALARAAVNSARARLVAASLAARELGAARERLSAREAAGGEVDRARRAVLVADRDAAALLASVSDLEAEVELLLSNASCPSCRAEFKPAQVKRVRAAYAPEIARKREGAALAAGTAARHRSALESAEAKVAALPAASQQEVGALEAAGSARSVEQAESQLKSAGAALWSAEGALAAARAEEFDVSVVQRVAADRAALEGNRAAADTRLQRADVTLSVAEYWLEAFGDRGIRSLLFDSVAGFLNARLAVHLSALACGEVSVAVSALTQGKGGGARERVSIQADWTWGGAGRGTGSAGQDRRVDLALFAALQDLAESRSSRPFPFKVWDEPGDALDARGQELFARWVEREAGARGTGFLVTHSQQLAEQVRAQHVWTVVMERGGARVEVR